ncbi:hypothetical protein H920_01363 [Fukomys damarensis]|uniref:Uncharacterized protein n=1 Tax=Fukomys damarensis TaxID=885580 RepID=A0A091DYS1_FUKDA|nr:hypothetical protein H920_01363 [Fukomys damarensis]
MGKTELTEQAKSALRRRGRLPQPGCQAVQRGAQPAPGVRALTLSSLVLSVPVPLVPPAPGAMGKTELTEQAKSALRRRGRLPQPGCQAVQRGAQPAPGVGARRPVY